LNIQATTVAISGELAIPFIAAKGGASFPSYPHLQAFTGPARAFLVRAKAKGVTVVLPTDLVMSEDALPPAVKSAAADPDARDEGAEFETDTKIVTVPDLAAIIAAAAAEAEAAAGEGSAEGQPPRPTEETAAPVVTPLPGFVHDLGPDSRAALLAALSSCALVVCWGTPGAVEASPCQQGTKDLLKAIAKALPEGGAEGESSSAATVQQHTVLLGESTVEWASRVADPAGELGGAVVQYGVYSCAVRRGAAWMAGLLGGLGMGSDEGLDGEGRPLEEGRGRGLVGSAGVAQREAEDSEWPVVPRRTAKVEPAEEEEEEDD